MIELLSQKQNRREFLRCFGRYMLLGTLVSTSGVLIAGRRSSSAQGEPVDISICRSCIFLSKCDQPKALLVRKEMAR